MHVVLEDPSPGTDSSSRRRWRLAARRTVVAVVARRAGAGVGVGVGGVVVATARHVASTTSVPRTAAKASKHACSPQTDGGGGVAGVDASTSTVALLIKVGT